jgi:hypothetical protein
MSQIKIKQVDGLQSRLDALDAQLAAGSLKSEYTQNGHGFAAGDVIAYLNGSWILADSSSADKLGRLVIESVTTNTFVAVQVGNIEIANWSLTPGKFYLVTEDGDGSIAEYVGPTNPDYVFSNPVLQAITSTKAQVLPWRPSLGGVAIAQGQEVTQNETPLATSGNESPTGITLDYRPFADGSIQVFVNSVAITESYGDKTGDVYFSNDGGTTSRSLADIDAGDELIWNGIVAGYELTTGDSIELVYEKSTLE